jgi:hypothetical protein
MLSTKTAPPHLEVLRAAQQWEVQSRYLDTPNRAPGSARAFRIGICQGVSEMAAALIGMALKDGNASGHVDPVTARLPKAGAAPARIDLPQPCTPSAESPFPREEAVGESGPVFGVS